MTVDSAGFRTRRHWQLPRGASPPACHSRKILKCATTVFVIKKQEIPLRVASLTEILKISRIIVKILSIFKDGNEGTDNLMAELVPTVEYS